MRTFSLSSQHTVGILGFLSLLLSLPLPNTTPICALGMSAMDRGEGAGEQGADQETQVGAWLGTSFADSERHRPT